ncbi:MAG: carbonic anhydrase [Betaproteobacteria bacterium]|nr:carbonic anhydrase [Betaproteobacteria bacterium]
MMLRANRVQPQLLSLLAAVVLSSGSVIAADVKPAAAPAPSAMPPAPPPPPAAAPAADPPPKKAAPTKRAAKPAPMPHWSYHGADGPDNWGKLHASYGLCDSGKQQSPIDIRGSIGVDLPELRFNYAPSRFSVANNGHTLEVAYSAGGSLTFATKTYQLVQFHFHRPAEEKIEGKSFEMVAHLVHRDAQGALAVVAVLMTVGAENPFIQALWNHIPLVAGQAMASAADISIDLNRFLPKERQLFNYMGSLTTPPCSEGVQWFVFKEPVEVSPEQLRTFARLFPNNARPIQPTHDRLIKESRGRVR